MSQSRPYVFIGSSTEGHRIAEAIQANLRMVCEPHIWSQGLFDLSSGTLETLIERLDDFDFAVLVLRGDDITISRGQESHSPRDNVILELGLFMGGLGRQRVFVVVDREARPKLLSDLAGVTVADYCEPELGSWEAAVGYACTEIKDAMGRHGSRKRSLHRLHIWPSMLRLAGNGYGIGLEVRNDDSKELPPYVIKLANPHGGTMAFFPSEKKGPLLPTQTRKHQCIIGPDPNGYNMANTFRTHRDRREMTEAEFSQWTLRLVLEDSETILFENAAYGLAITKAICQAAEQGPSGITNDLWKPFFGQSK